VRPWQVLRTHQYKPEAVELTTLQRCQRQMVERAIEGGGIGGVMVHHALKLPAMAYLSFVRIPLAMGAGLACAYYRCVRVDFKTCQTFGPLRVYLCVLFCY
jgi:hypothetical protein